MTIFLGEKENRQRQVEESTALGSSRLGFEEKEPFRLTALGG
jgi:hypothetical protein